MGEGVGVKEVVWVEVEGVVVVGVWEEGEEGQVQLRE